MWMSSRYPKALYAPSFWKGCVPFKDPDISPLQRCLALYPCPLTTHHKIVTGKHWSGPEKNYRSAKKVLQLFSLFLFPSSPIKLILLPGRHLGKKCKKVTFRLLAGMLLAAWLPCQQEGANFGRVCREWLSSRVQQAEVHLLVFKMMGRVMNLP